MKPAQKGFGLLEVTLALLILGLLAWLGVELFRTLGQRRQRSAFIADMRAIAEVFERHAAHSPMVASPAGAPVVLPAALDTALKETNWHRGSPFGGTYEWIPPPTPPTVTPATGSREDSPATPSARDPAVSAVLADPVRPTQRESQPKRPLPSGIIAVTAFAPSFPLTATRADLLHVDTAIDDGNLATGRFRTGFNGWPVYHLGEP